MKARGLTFKSLIEKLAESKEPAEVPDNPGGSDGLKEGVAKPACDTVVQREEPLSASLANPALMLLL